MRTPQATFATQRVHSMTSKHAVMRLRCGPACSHDLPEARPGLGQQRLCRGANDGTWLHAVRQGAFSKRATSFVAAVLLPCRCRMATSRGAVKLRASPLCQALALLAALLMHGIWGDWSVTANSACGMLHHVFHHHHLHTSSSGRPVGCKSTLLKQRLNTHKQQLRTLGLQIIIHHTHAPVHEQSHRLTVTTTHQGTDVSERFAAQRFAAHQHDAAA